MPIRIVFLGNSLTAAYGLEPEEGFVSHLQTKIHQAGIPSQILNAGISGETTSGGLYRMDYLLKNKFDLLVVELGINDALQGVSYELIKRNLIGIIAKVQTEMPGATILLLGIKPWPELPIHQPKAFENLYHEVSQQKKVLLAPDLMAGIKKHGTHLLFDGLHPNAEGHRLIAEEVWPSLKMAMEKPR